MSRLMYPSIGVTNDTEGLEPQQLTPELQAISTARLLPSSVSEDSTGAYLTPSSSLFSQSYEDIPATGICSCYQRIPKRYIITALITLSNILCYADRTNIGIAKQYFNPPFTETENGYILSAFFYGYILTQSVGGYLSSRFGGKPVLLGGVLIWIVADGMTVPTARSHILWVLIVARVAMGIGEGVNFPADHNLSGQWFMKNERSTLATIMSSGCDLGTILSTGVSPIIAASPLGWEGMYYVYCGYGVVWLLLFYIFGYSSPETHPSIHPRELHDIQESRTISHGEEDNTTVVQRWKVILSSKCVYGIMGAHFFFNYGFYVLLNWLPTYFTKAQNVDLAEKGFVTNAMPYIGGAIGGILSGQIADAMIRRGFRIRHVRKLMNTIGGLGGGIPLIIIAIYLPTDATVATILLTVSMFLFRFSAAGYWTNMIDVFPLYAGEIMSISNTLATVPGIVGNTLTGYILDTTDYNWTLVFALAGGSYFLGMIVFMVFADDKDLSWKIQEYHGRNNHRDLFKSLDETESLKPQFLDFESSEYQHHLQYE